MAKAKKSTAKLSDERVTSQRLDGLQALYGSTLDDPVYRAHWQQAEIPIALILACEHTDAGANYDEVRHQFHLEMAERLWDEVAAAAGERRSALLGAARRRADRARDAGDWPEMAAHLDRAMRIATKGAR